MHLIDTAGICTKTNLFCQKIHRLEDHHLVDSGSSHRSNKRKALNNLSWQLGKKVRMYGRKSSVACTTQNTVVKYPYNAVKIKHRSPDVFVQFELSLCTRAILTYTFHFLEAYQIWKLPGRNPDEWMKICRIKSIWFP
mmetsp:Transcript_20843/g.30828  ORF Transcript_20843/g.30828 Transcript_20843/m.30828 type:complete len:138 (-) Transcript_20843:186-599(-)